MKFFFFILIIFTYENTYGQWMEGENTKVIFKAHMNKSNDSVTIEIVNKSDLNVLVYGLTDINAGKYRENYIGIGLYAGTYPFFPDLMTKVLGNIKLNVIQPRGNRVFKLKFTNDISKPITLSLDYMTDSKTILNDSNVVKREIYDTNFEMLKIVAHQSFEW